MSGPYMPNLEALIAAGIDPKTGLPLKVTGSTPAALKENIRKNYRVMDEQDAINHFTWYNLPSGLTGQMIERILYYKGQGMFFYMAADDRFYFLPYALDGTIDCYGRFMGVTPLPFGGGTTKTADGKEKPWIQGLNKKPIYELNPIDDKTYDRFMDGCVLLKDYSPQLSETIIPRQQLNDPVLDIMSDIACYERTALLNSTGIQGMRIESEDEYSNVAAASASMNKAAICGEKWVPIIGKVDFQDLSASSAGVAEEFQLALRSFDNMRLGFHGLDNGGIFEKKSHMLTGEQQAGGVGLVEQDKLSNRQRFADLVNNTYGLQVGVTVSESASGIDFNADGALYDQPTQAQPAAAEQEAETNDM